MIAMRKHHPSNERVKRDYFTYLREARGRCEQTIDAVAAALVRFEAHTRYRDFKRFHIETALSFKRALSDEVNGRTGKPLSESTVLKTLSALRQFFQWLSREPGYRSSFSYADADYFSLSKKEKRIAKACPDKRVPTIEQVVHVLNCMPTKTEIDCRNRALIAFCLLTGARDGAIASFKLKHFDVVEDKVVQDAREVRTKFSKTFTTWFLPIPDEVRQIVLTWVEFLKREKLFGPDDPLFPSTKVGHRNGSFASVGLSRVHWRSAAPIREVFKAAFAQASLPYCTPHSFRSTLVQLGERICKSPEEFKAYSQNLGHDSVLTTFSSYGRVSHARQSELIKKLGQKVEVRREDPVFQQLVERVIAELSPAR
jgi:integrase/recombinase XerD